MNSDEQMRETVRRARELMAFVSPDPDHWDDHNREIAAALCNEELPALCNDNDTLRAELARVMAELDALCAIVEEFNAARAALSKVHPALRIAPWGRAAVTRMEQAEAALHAWPEVSRG